MLKIQVSQKILQELRSRADEYGFTSPEEFVCYILNEVLDAIKEKGASPESKTVSEREQKELEAQLESLGYM